MPGFIHDKLDVKLLILYLASKLAGPVDFATLNELAQCDGGMDYFKFAEGAAELVKSGHLSIDGDGLYAITGKGRRNIADSADSLSPVIRRRCDQNVAPLNEELRRKAQVRSQVVPADGGGSTLRIAMGEGPLELFSVSLWSPTDQALLEAGERFQADPKRIYEGLLALLLEDPGKSEGSEADGA